MKSDRSDGFEGDARPSHTLTLNGPPPGPEPGGDTPLACDSRRGSSDISLCQAMTAREEVERPPGLPAAQSTRSASENAAAAAAEAEVPTSVAAPMTQEPLTEMAIEKKDAPDKQVPDAWAQWRENSP